MLIKSMILCAAISLSVISCGHINHDDRKLVTNEFVNDQPTTVASADARLSQKEKETIYATLFSAIYHNENIASTLGSRIYGDLIYRVKSTNSGRTKAVENNVLIDEELLTSYRFENQSPERLPTEELTIWPVFSFDKNAEVKELFSIGKRTRTRKTEAAVVFSNLGFNQAKNESLVYVEYYNEKVGLKTFWLHLKLAVINRPLEMFGRFAGVEKITFIDGETSQLVTKP